MSGRIAGGAFSRALAPAPAFLLAITLALIAGCPGSEAPPAKQPAPPARIDAGTWNEVVASEELIHSLRPSLRRLERSLENLRLPDVRSRADFDVAVRLRDIVPMDFAAPAGLITSPALAALQTSSLLLQDPRPPVAPGDLDLWRPILKQVIRVEDAAFSTRSGHFAGQTRDRFETRHGVRARLILAEGGIAGLLGDVRLQWRRTAPGTQGEKPEWRITGFLTESVEIRRAPHRLFDEVLDEVLSDPDVLNDARSSRHAEWARRKLLEPESFEAPHSHFFLGSQDRHPGVAVADVNGDGFDDIYALRRFGPALLFVSTGDGRFEERAAEYGLAIEDHNASAVFADFDNDGDLDVFVGRTLAPSIYLERIDDRYVDRSSTAFTAPLPGLVSAVNAVDADGDGRLDLYLSTYAAQLLVAERARGVRDRSVGGHARTGMLLEDHLVEADARALHASAGSQGAHEFLSLPGPPNVLFANKGHGHFEPIKGASPLRSFRNTYQAAWADYDDDGDADVYLAHDFAPNQLLRNDGPMGFSDVTSETGTADIGFGMGASWGDYDRDGRMDLYVSNMFSKAGRRITQRIEGLDERYANMARGNSLFRNTARRFERVSGMGPDELPVEASGWSWGGQFADFDNDGRLDLHVLNGYYTAPAEAHVDVDI